MHQWSLLPITIEKAMRWRCTTCWRWAATQNEGECKGPQQSFAGLTGVAVRAGHTSTSSHKEAGHAPSPDMCYLCCNGNRRSTGLVKPEIDMHERMLSNERDFEHPQQGLERATSKARQRQIWGGNTLPSWERMSIQTRRKRETRMRLSMSLGHSGRSYSAVHGPIPC